MSDRKLWIIRLICAVIFVISITQLIHLRQERQKNVEIHEQLLTLQELSALSEEAQPYQEYLDLNSDFVGWIQIDGTKIDYPVVQSQNNPDFYLHHDFYKKKNRYGNPYLDSSCSIEESNNLILYGHHMKDGSMFAGLTEYESPSFCESHGTIRFDTMDSVGNYQVILVMKITAEEAEKFQFHRCHRLSTAAIYQEYLERCREYAIWTAEESADFGEKLLTLSTCEYSRPDGRLVVVAKKIEA